MARKKWIYGKSVVDGRVRFLSPSTIVKADAGTGGCLRKFFYRYVLGLKEDDRGEKPWLELGEQCHGEIEAFINTGANVLGRITSATRRFIPRGRVLVEYDIGGGVDDLSAAKLTADGVPIVGYTDIISLESAINDDGSGYHDDPPGTVEIGDWKFPSNPRGSERDFSLAAHEVADDIQVVTYGEFVARTARPEAPLQHARLSLVYTNTKKRIEAWKVSALVDRDHLARRWEYVEAVVRTIKDAARQTDVESIPGNASACDSFGGCAYRETCTVGKYSGLDDFFGVTGSHSFLTTLNTEGSPMSLLAGLNIPQAPVVTASPAGVVATLGILPNGMQAMAAGKMPSGAYIAAIRAIHAKGYGFPPLAGEAAEMYGVLNGRSSLNSTGGVDGWGQLGKLAPVTEGARIEGIAGELGGVPNNPTPDTKPVVAAASRSPTPPLANIPPTTGATIGILPPDAPASNPAMASVPVAGFTPVNALTPGVEIPGLIASVPPAAAATILAANAPAVDPAAALPEPASAPKRRGGRPLGSGKKSATTEPEAFALGAGAWLFVDVDVNVPTTDLAPMIDSWAVAAAKHFRCDPVDIRCAKGSDNPAAFGGWKGVMTATARKAIRGLPEGAYSLKAAGNEIYTAALEGLAMARVSDDDGADAVFTLVVRG